MHRTKRDKSGAAEIPVLLLLLKADMLILYEPDIATHNN